VAVVVFVVVAISVEANSRMHVRVVEMGFYHGDGLMVVVFQNVPSFIIDVSE